MSAAGVGGDGCVVSVDWCEDAGDEHGDVVGCGVGCDVASVDGVGEVFGG